MQNRSEAALVALRRILRATELNARTLARSTGLTPSQLIVLNLVAHLGDATPTELARRASLTLATMTTLVDRLEDRGLITRRRDENDRRRMLIRITRAGKKTLDAAPDALQLRFQERFDALADWEQASLIAALERAAALLGAKDIDAAPVLDIGALTELPDGG
ncbi:MAG: MarR family transcriptional regulator [Pseudomonadota bacterium]|nr:MarR family transcriptional regulator [Pseudomonadota bacterium]